MTTKEEFLKLKEDLNKNYLLEFEQGVKDIEEFFTKTLEINILKYNIALHFDDNTKQIQFYLETDKGWLCISKHLMYQVSMAHVYSEIKEETQYLQIYQITEIREFLMKIL